MKVLMPIFLFVSVLVWIAMAIPFTYLQHQFEKSHSSRNDYLDSCIKYVFTDDVLYHHYYKLEQEEGLKEELILDKMDKLLGK